MDTWLIVVLLAVAVIVVIAAIVAVMVKRHRQVVDLGDRFGPEYDRAMSDTDGRRGRKDVRTDLADRAERRDQLDIRELSPSARDRYGEAWSNVQARFVDEPQAEAGGGPGAAADAVARLEHRRLDAEATELAGGHKAREPRPHDDHVRSAAHGSRARSSARDGRSRSGRA